MNIEHIIFDYGAVIFEINHHKTIQAFKDLGFEGFEENFGHLSQNGVFDEFERGSITPKVFREKIKTQFNQQVSDEQFDMAWNAMLLGIPDENLDLLLQVKNKFSTYLLSNNNEIHYQWINQYLQAEKGIKGMMKDFFIKEYYSHLVGKRKPDASIFEQVKSEMNLNTSNTLFIDDTIHHIKTATALGFQTYLKPIEEPLSDTLSKLKLI